MKFRFKFVAHEPEGGHTRVKLFANEVPDFRGQYTLANCGELTLRTPEWHALKSALESLGYYEEGFEKGPLCLEVDHEPDST